MQDTYEITTRAFRDALGTSVVRSTFLLSASVRDATLRIEGAGRGHGVGLCQWGTRVLGETRSAADIVAFYFPGTFLGSA
jgi:stage II sporulation protein D